MFQPLCWIRRRNSQRWMKKSEAQSKRHYSAQLNVQMSKQVLLLLNLVEICSWL
jgi:hypothetical protein